MNNQEYSDLIEQRTQELMKKENLTYEQARLIVTEGRKEVVK